MKLKKIAKYLIEIIIVFGLLTGISYFLGLKTLFRTKFCIQEPCPDAGFYGPRLEFIPLWIVLAIVISIVFEKMKNSGRS